MHQCLRVCVYFCVCLCVPVSSCAYVWVSSRAVSICACRTMSSAIVDVMFDRKIIKTDDTLYCLLWKLRWILFILCELITNTSIASIWAVQIVDPPSICAIILTWPVNPSDSCNRRQPVNGRWCIPGIIKIPHLYDCFTSGADFVTAMYGTRYARYVHKRQLMFCPHIHM